MTALGLRVTISTWNVNNMLATQIIDTSWLRSVLESESDVVVFAFQEAGLNLKGLITGGLKKTRTLWEETLMRAVEASSWGSSRYVLVQSEHMVGLLLIVFAKMSVAARISEVQTTKVGTGIGNRAGNKGAVALRFKYHGRSLAGAATSSSSQEGRWYCFTNCHLAAHQDKTERRERDLREIFNRVKFSNGAMLIADHDYAFLIGDLNFRIDAARQEVMASITGRDWKRLLRSDQLLNSPALLPVGWREGPIAFRPTFKLQVGSSEYSSKRIPAWCDRILIKTAATRLHFVQETYESSEILLSDHLPVLATYHTDAPPSEPNNASLWQWIKSVLCCGRSREASM